MEWRDFLGRKVLLVFLEILVFQVKKENLEILADQEVPEFREGLVRVGHQESRALMVYLAYPDFEATLA